jgi:hypothetical protein
MAVHAALCVKGPRRRVQSSPSSLADGGSKARSLEVLLLGLYPFEARLAVVGGVRAIEPTLDGPDRTERAGLRWEGFHGA